MDFRINVLVILSCFSVICRIIETGNTTSVIISNQSEMMTISNPHEYKIKEVTRKGPDGSNATVVYVETGTSLNVTCSRAILPSTLTAIVSGSPNRTANDDGKNFNFPYKHQGFSKDENVSCLYQFKDATADILVTVTFVQADAVKEARAWIVTFYGNVTVETTVDYGSTVKLHCEHDGDTFDDNDVEWGVLYPGESGFGPLYMDTMLFGADVESDPIIYDKKKPLAVNYYCIVKNFVTVSRIQSSPAKIFVNPGSIPKDEYVPNPKIYPQRQPWIPPTLPPGFPTSGSLNSAPTFVEDDNLSNLPTSALVAIISLPIISLMLVIVGTIIGVLLIRRRRRRHPPLPKIPLQRYNKQSDNSADIFTAVQSDNQTSEVMHPYCEIYEAILPDETSSETPHDSYLIPSNTRNPNQKVERYYQNDDFHKNVTPSQSSNVYSYADADLARAAASIKPMYETILP